MSALVADVAFDFIFPSPSPSPSLEDDPATPPLRGVSLDASLGLDVWPQNVLDMPFLPAVQPVRQHGPLLLPRIRPQDQEIDQPLEFQPAPKAHGSYAAPDVLGGMAFAPMMTPFATPPPRFDEFAYPSSLLCSPPAQSLDTAPVERSSHRHIMLLPSTPTTLSHSDYVFPSASFLSRVPTPPPVMEPAAPPTTTLMAYLTAANPAASLVQTVSFPLRDPSIKHFWWDVRNVRSWSGFNAYTVLSLPGASALLNAPVPLPALPTPPFPSRHPDTEASLYAICASYYLPKVNAALAVSYGRPLQLSVPSKSSSSAGAQDFIFTANPAGESSTAAAMFGGKPTARVVGLVRSFTRFNTGMRSEGNIKRVDYLRGLAALHHAMREHGCRYGFILTEIELVLVRCGVENTPFFGDLDITSVQLSASSTHDSPSDAVPLTACLALWGLCQLAGSATPAGHAHWKAEIGAPAEGSRRKAKARDSWIPQPQLAEKREAKRSRGWVWPEDPIGRKELGKRGIKYGGL